VDPAGLRAAFPVLERVAFLNAGTDGPIPAAATAAAVAELERERDRGRTREHFERRQELSEAQRAAYARLLGTAPDHVALTTSTSEGIASVLAGMELGPGDEILCAQGEHPGLLGPLQAARDLRGVTVRTVPLAQLAREVGSTTRLVACGHVGWRTGELAPVEALAELAPNGPPVLYDGAQAVGAIPVDVDELCCAAYAGSGQKWLCGPDGTGMLYVSPRFSEQIATARRSYLSFSDATAGLGAPLHDEARRLDAPALPAAASAHALAALEILDGFGWDALLARASELASELTMRLSERGRATAPRGASTLVAWHSDEPDADLERLTGAGVVVRGLPGGGLLRASVGAWNDESDLERLLRGLGR